MARATGMSTVEVLGVNQTRTLLARFEPDLLKRMNADLDVITRKLREGAQRNFERTGATGTAYRTRTRTRVAGFSKGVTTTPGSVARGEKWSSEPGVLARVFELANGVRNAMPQNAQRVRSLIATLNARYGQPGRFLWQEWDEQKAESLAAVKLTVEQVEAEYTRRLA
jgi:hypothetical protein